jgi:hypothetical protein
MLLELKHAAKVPGTIVSHQILKVPGLSILTSFWMVGLLLLWGPQHSTLSSPCYSTWYVDTCVSISVTWDLCRDAESQAPPKPTETESMYYLFIYLWNWVPPPMWLSCWTWLGAMRNEKQRHTDIKTQSWDWEDCMFLVGYMNAYLSQSVYFIGQCKGVNQVKSSLHTSAILLI